MTMPSPENIVLYLGAVGLGLGTAAGLGYAACLPRVTKARIHSYREWDEAQKQSTLGKLAEATRLLESHVARNEAISREVERLKADFEAEKTLSEELHRELIRYSLTVLHLKGHVALDGLDLGLAPRTEFGTEARP